MVKNEKEKTTWWQILLVVFVLLVIYYFFTSFPFSENYDSSCVDNCVSGQYSCFSPEVYDNQGFPYTSDLTFEECVDELAHCIKKC